MRRNQLQVMNRRFVPRFCDDAEAIFVNNGLLVVYQRKELISDVPPEGFARFSIEAMNPNILDLPQTLQREFEILIGCSVRKIWRRV